MNWKLKRCIIYLTMLCLASMVISSILQTLKFCVFEYHSLKEKGFQNTELKNERIVFENMHWSKQIQICRRKLQWKNRNRDQTLRTNVDFSLIEVSIGESNQNFYGKVKIETFDWKRRRKFLGGDYYRVFVVEKSRNYKMHVRMFDHHDGTYTGIFNPPYGGHYSLEATIEYSMCEGFTDPPEDWFKKGSIQGEFQPEGTIGELDHFINRSFPNVKFTIRQKSFNSGKFKKSKHVINTNRGYWLEGKYHGSVLEHKNLLPKSRKSINTTSLQKLIVYGDSLNYRFYNSLTRHRICKEIFRECVRVYLWNYKHEGEESNNFLHDRTTKTGDDFNRTKYLDQVRTEMLQMGTQVFVINFGIHLTSTVGFATALSVFDDFLKMVDKLRLQLGAQMPLVIWKTTTPPFFEYSRHKMKTTSRFITKQRIDAWNSYTMEKCKENEVPVLDVWDQAISSTSTYDTVDFIHLKDEVFSQAENDLEEFIKLYFSYL